MSFVAEMHASMTQYPIERLARARRMLPAPDVRRAIREASGLSQTDVATHLGVGQRSVSRWETGQSDPTKSVLVRYVDLLVMLTKVNTETR